MLKVLVMVSGGGTNLQAIIDSVENGTVTNAKIVGVISNNQNAYALKRADKHGIAAECVSPKNFENRAAFNEKLLERVNSYEPDLIVLRRIPCGDPAGDDRSVQKPDDQYSSVFDPGFLRNRILRAESARSGACARRESSRRNGAFCG